MVSSRWDTYLGHDLPKPLSDSARNELRSGDPGPMGQCIGCDADIHDGDVHIESEDGELVCEDCIDNHSPDPEDYL